MTTRRVLSPQQQASAIADFESGMGWMAVKDKYKIKGQSTVKRLRDLALGPKSQKRGLKPRASTLKKPKKTKSTKTPKSWTNITVVPTEGTLIIPETPKLCTDIATLLLTVYRDRYSNSNGVRANTSVPKEGMRLLNAALELLQC